MKHTTINKSEINIIPKGNPYLQSAFDELYYIHIYIYMKYANMIGKKLVIMNEE